VKPTGTNPLDHLAAARLAAMKRFPYYRAAILTLIPRETRGLGTLGVTEHGVLMWDPEAAMSWTVEGLGTVLVHEASHLLRRHAARRKALSADPEQFNIAADCEINDDLVAAGCELPEGGIIPKMLGFPDGLTAEEYFRMMEQDGGGEGGQSKEDEAGNQKQKGGAAGVGKGEPGPCKGKCGGCAGNPLPGEAEAEAEVAGGRTEAEMRRMSQTVAEAVRALGEKGQGTCPAGIRRWAAAELTPPKVRWQDKLARIVRGACAYRTGAVDYSYSRTSRRQAGVGFGAGRPVLPALVAPRPKVAVVIDTSGSMGEKDLGECLRELSGILSAVGGEVELGACDAEVHELRRVSSWRQAGSLLKGGGGTDMRPAIKALAERGRLRPDVAIFATDGMIGDPGPAPAYRVIWCVVGEHPFACPWGEIVEVT